MKVTFDRVVDESSYIKTFYFKSERPLQYTAGQFIELTIPHEKPDDRGIKRWFTLSSSPTDELISITTRVISKCSTYKQALMALEKEVEVTVSDPMGDFVLPKYLQTPLIFVAGGIGITPYHSMLKWLAETNEQRPIRLLYAVKNEGEIIFLDTFAKADQHATILVSDPSAAWGGERGHLTADMILNLEKPSNNTLVYVSGPEPMVEQLEKDLKKAGLKKEQLVLDFFPNYDAE
jgi:ferredoxin-NADP reductase